MRRTAHSILVLAACFVSGVLHAQLPPMYEQYHLNQLAFNPAYAGSMGVLEANFFFHRNAVNFGNGSPGTEAFSVHTPLANDRVGLGAKFYHDEIGVTSSTHFGIDYAYRIHISDNLTAAIGIEASITNVSVALNELDAYNGGDPAFMDELESYLLPDAGAGVYLHSDKYYIGLSSISLFAFSGATTTEKISDDVQFDRVNTFYGTAGTLIPTGEKLALNPNLLIKMAEGLPTQIDAGLNIIWNNAFLIGGSYRTNNSVSFVGEYIYSSDNKITRHEAGIGYSFNKSFSDDGLFLSPSHEIFLVYRFDKYNNKFVNPRFF